MTDSEPRTTTSCDTKIQFNEGVGVRPGHRRSGAGDSVVERGEVGGAKSEQEAHYTRFSTLGQLFMGSGRRAECKRQ
ncbi:hypothetical protein E2C01_050191 [Portunus trituberculatus]|uniref:Uncharacterized protein n=1 Tax=Portunus trituberculatus TaxID=210409 RepID=A0A5B7GGM5_PORTR|nr:hypothetical protein [Portunus trituberculatus]